MTTTTIPAALSAELPRGVDLDDCDATTYGALDREHTVEAHSLTIADDAPVLILPGWLVDDGNQEVEYPLADSGAEAAEEYVSDGDWGDDDSSTSWVSVRAWRRAITLDEDGDPVDLVIDKDWHRIEIEPEEPECIEGEDHDWQSPYSVLGGVKENPGVWGHGGGAVIKTVCSHCGRYRITDTWAQDRTDGSQGLTSIEYEDADDSSMAWVAALASEAMVAAVAPVADVLVQDGRGYIRDYAPDALDGDTSPGSAWDEECDRRLADVRRALPSGWEADWSDDDIVITWTA